MALDLNKARKCLADFDFSKLFIEELGWSQPPSRQIVATTHKDAGFTRRQLAQLAGVMVLEIKAQDGQIPDAKTRAALHKEISALHHENLLIFVDERRAQSLWYWVKRQDGKASPRDHIYVRGQPGDLFLSKLNSMVFDLGDFDEAGNVPLVEVADRLKEALDIERVTKKFYTEFQDQHLEFLNLIKGIDDDHDRRWYASVLLNRLMFIYFLQRKFFLDGGDGRYLQNKLDQSREQGRDQYYEKFLKVLFFEGFAKPEDKRSAKVNTLLGKIKYLNGGLFLHHRIELQWPGISIPDSAFVNLFALFERYSWNLDDTPGGQADEINPDVLGYIFEKYINQKAFGAYYTRPEITEYLCERTIHRLILDRVNSSGTGVPPVIPGQDAHVTSLNPLAPVNIRKGAYLPHWTQEGATYAVNFRLFDSLPADVLKQWVAERDDIVKTARQLGRELSDVERGRLAQLHSEKVEKWLDAGHGACWLKDPHIAPIVADALAHFDGDRYDLLAWCMMPNHVHAVLRPKAGHELPDILHSWKSFTSKKANKVLIRTGEFWQAEYYDHLIRDESDFRKQVEYVLENPAKAGLVDWRWVDGGTGVPPVKDHGQDGRATTKKHGRDAHATFDNMGDLLLALDAPLCKKLLYEVLPNLRLLDPACGSAAFLVSAMKTLINVYAAVIGKIEFLSDHELRKWRQKTQNEHKSIPYFIKRSIITNNLFGVDIMEEAIEIAKLRLFLALVASANSVDDLEPLPNIEFNIMTGNSLIGLLHVDPAKFDALAGVAAEQKRMTLRYEVHESELGFAVESKVGKTRKEKEREYTAQVQGRKFAELLDEKNELIALYRRATGYGEDLQELRDGIEQKKAAAKTMLNRLLLTQFQSLEIRYEEATWDEKKNEEGKPNRRALKESDITALKPFHWGYEFDQIINERGGFDAIITNPPWEIFKPIAKEFCYEYDPDIERRGTDIKDFEKRLGKLLDVPAVRKKYLEYLGGYPHVSAFYRSAPQYKNQISIVDGKKAGTDINLYKLFVEQCFNLLRRDGYCGMVIPSGIYTDLGTKQLREMLFAQTKVTGLFCFENRKAVFEGVDSRFKFLVLSFEKGGVTENFPAAFMRHDVADLDRFPQEGSISISVAIVRRLSPKTLSVVEFKNETDVTIAETLLKHPPLGQQIDEKWQVAFYNEFHMTNDSRLFKTEPRKSSLPLFEGKMIWHYECERTNPRYWIDEEAGRAALLGRTEDKGQELDYQQYRFAYRSITGNTNERTVVCSVLPRNCFFGHSLNALSRCRSRISSTEMLYFTALMTSFVMDYTLRQRVATQLTMFFVYQVPVPRLTGKDAGFEPVVRRAARLICTTPEFDDLAKEIFGGRQASAAVGATDPVERAKLRAELDGLIAHLYGLTEDEFAYILTTFPLVADPVKDAARNAYRDIERGLIK